MAPQDDLTAERAARLYRDLMSIIHSDPHPIDQPCGICLAAIAGHDRETRQETMRMAAKVVMDNEGSIGLALYELHRLASEGG